MLQADSSLSCTVVSPQQTGAVILYAQFTCNNFDIFCRKQIAPHHQNAANRRSVPCMHLACQLTCNKLTSLLQAGCSTASAVSRPQQTGAVCIVRIQKHSHAAPYQHTHRGPWSIRLWPVCGGESAVQHKPQLQCHHINISWRGA